VQDMNIEQIRVERMKAEDAIYAVLDEFRANTGLSIVACGVETFICHALGEESPEVIVTGVKLEIEPL